MAAKDMRALRSDVEHRGYCIVPIGQRKLERSFAIARASGGVPFQCWVHIDENHYRDVFHRFLTLFHNFPPKLRLPSDIAIDHVVNRQYARKVSGEQYFLVAMAEFNINSEFGRNWERLRQENSLAPRVAGEGFGGLADLSNDFKEIEKYSQGGLYTMFSWPLAIKVFAKKAPDRDVSLAYVLQVIKELIKEGLVRDSDLRIPFGLWLANFRAGMAGIPSYDAQMRSYIAEADAIDGLTLESTASDWIDAISKLQPDVAGRSTS